MRTAREGQRGVRSKEQRAGKPGRKIARIFGDDIKLYLIPKTSAKSDSTKEIEGYFLSQFSGL